MQVALFKCVVNKVPSSHCKKKKWLFLTFKENYHFRVLCDLVVLVFSLIFCLVVQAEVKINIYTVVYCVPTHERLIGQYLLTCG